MLERAAERIYAGWLRMCGEFVTFRPVRRGRPSRFGAVRALVVTNLWPAPDAPHRGIFVADQVAALRRRGDVEVDVLAFPPGPRALLRAIATRAPAHPRAAVRRRARPLRPVRVAGARGAPRTGGRDPARQRSLRAPVEPREPRRAAAHGARGDRVARVRGQPAGRRRTPADRGAAGRRRARALPADPARGGARPARARPRGALPALPARPVAPAQARRPRTRAGRRRPAARPWAASRPRRCRTGSTPPTPCSCRRRTRASGCR